MDIIARPVVRVICLRYVKDCSEEARRLSAKTISMRTSKGKITIEVDPDRMPVTAGNFIDLVSQGFYDGLTFHRVEHWVVQGGDPKGDGTGGSGKRIKLETHPDLRNVRGCIAMARAQHPDSASSQFYFLKKDAPWLDGQYAVFGMVKDGMSVVDSIEAGDRMETVRVVEPGTR